KARVGRELGWPAADAQLAEAEEALRDLMIGTEEPSAAAKDSNVKTVTLSLVDRFDSVLDAGRRIASALSRDAIFAAAREAAARLLRGERCMMLKVEATPAGGPDVTTVSGELNAGYSKAMVSQALAAGRAVAFL